MTVFGRRARPVALWLSVATVGVGVVAASGQVPGVRLDRLAGDIIGAIALLSAVVMWAGWWGRRDTWTTAGVAIACGVWAAFAAVTGVEAVERAQEPAAAGDWPRVIAIFLSSYLALCWAGVAASSWWIERREGPRR